MKENISRKSCHENFSIKKSIHKFTVNMYTDQAIVIKMISIDQNTFIPLLHPHSPPPPCTLRRSALVFYIPITISRDVIHVTDLFLYVFAICSSFTTNFGQIHSSVLKSSCFTYWYLSQFPEMLHMFIHLFMYHADLFYVHLLNIPHVPICLVRSEL